MTHPIPKPGISHISPYTPGKTSRKAGSRPIKLSSNENCYGPSVGALSAFVEASRELHRYPDGGAVALRKAIARAHGLEAERIVCGAGSDELIGLLVHAYAGPEDEVLYSAHGFLMYKIYTLAAGATPVTAPEQNLTADVDALLAAVTERTKIVFLANPNNPTGSYLPASELERLHAGLPEHVILAVDAAYSEYGEEMEDYSNGRKLAATTPNTVMLRTFSKIYALPSLRLGWMYGPPAIVDTLNRVRSPFNVNGVAQATGIAALEETSWLEQQCRHNSVQRMWLMRELETLGLEVYPSIANFLLADCGTKDMADRLISGLAERDIYIRDVANYGLPHCMRITVGKPEENLALIHALKGMV